MSSSASLSSLSSPRSIAFLAPPQCTGHELLHQGWLHGKQVRGIHLASQQFGSGQPPPRGRLLKSIIKLRGEVGEPPETLLTLLQEELLLQVLLHGEEETFQSTSILSVEYRLLSTSYTF